jgi:hypothetical protein
VKYLLILMIAQMPPVQVGPFDDLLACEKAATMVIAARKEVGRFSVASVCVGVKNVAFYYKEPVKK